MNSIMSVGKSGYTLSFEKAGVSVNQCLWTLGEL